MNKSIGVLHNSTVYSTYAAKKLCKKHKTNGIPTILCSHATTAVTTKRKRENKGKDDEWDENK